jgi:hypothetical protein
MLTKGGQKATAGIYWNMMNGERVDLEQADVLPGDAGTMYIKAPSAVMLAAGPVLGAIFAVFLPLIAIVTAVTLLGGKIIEGMAIAARSGVIFGWRPIESYLTGRRKKEVREKKEAKEAGKQ